MRDPGGWSRPRGVNDTSRIKTGTSTVVNCGPFTMPTVTTSCGIGGAGPALRRPERRLATTVAPMTCNDFAWTFIRFSYALVHFMTGRARPRRRIVSGRCPAHFEMSVGYGGFARTALIAEHRENRVDADGEVSISAGDFDFRDDCRARCIEGQAARIVRDEIRHV